MFVFVFQRNDSKVISLFTMRFITPRGQSRVRRDSVKEVKIYVLCLFVCLFVLCLCFIQIAPWCVFVHCASYYFKQVVRCASHRPLKCEVDEVKWQAMPAYTDLLLPFLTCRTSLFWFFPQYRYYFICNHLNMIREAPTSLQFVFYGLTIR